MKQLNYNTLLANIIIRLKLNEMLSHMLKPENKVI